MPRKKHTKKKQVESLKHRDKRKNIPTEELRDFVVGDEEKPPVRQARERQDRHQGHQPLRRRSAESLRGRSERLTVIVRALHDPTSDRPTRIVSSVPSQSCGLQAIDYFLWALQRMYERGEVRYFEFVREHYRLIMDFDDRRAGTRYGRWYSDQDPLTREKLMPVTG